MRPEREPVEKLKRREVDDAIGARPRGLAAATGSDPVGRLMSRQHVADADDAAVGVADHGEPFQRKGRPCAIPQQLFELLPKMRRAGRTDVSDLKVSVNAAGLGAPLRRGVSTGGCRGGLLPRCTCA